MVWPSDLWQSIKFKLITDVDSIVNTGKASVIRWMPVLSRDNF